MWAVQDVRDMELSVLICGLFVGSITHVIAIWLHDQMQMFGRGGLRMLILCMCEA